MVLLLISARPPAPRWRREPIRELLGFGVPASLAAASWFGFRNCDYAIIGARLGAVPTGLYFRAYSLGVEYQKKVSNVMNTVGFPVLARTQSGEEMDVLRARMVRILTIVLFPLLVLLAIEAPVLVPWLFGHRWSPAVAPTQILALGGASTLVIDTAGATLMASGRARAVMGFGWGHFVTYALVVFFVAPLGITAIAIGASAVHTAFLLVSYVLMMHGTGRPPMRRLWHDVKPAVVCCTAPPCHICSPCPRSAQAPICWRCACAFRLRCAACAAWSDTCCRRTLFVRWRAGRRPPARGSGQTSRGAGESRDGPEGQHAAQGHRRRAVPSARRRCAGLRVGQPAGCIQGSYHVHGDGVPGWWCGWRGVCFGVWR